jgi:hypothetical protein
VTVDLRQQLQFNPDIELYNNRYGDFFNEESFWPIPDRYKELEDEDDLDDAPAGAGNGIPDRNGELDDLPRQIEWEWRSSSVLQTTYRIQRWFRLNQIYTFQYNGERGRHTFRIEPDYRPLQHWKKKGRVLDPSLRLQFQYAGQPDDGQYEWVASLAPRFTMDIRLKKDHILSLNSTLNGEWDDGVLEFDRWRFSPQFLYTYKKNHRFTLGYQFQQRIDKPDRITHGFSLGYEIRLRSSGADWGEP